MVGGGWLEWLGQSMGYAVVRLETNNALLGAQGLELLGQSGEERGHRGAADISYLLPHLNSQILFLI